MRERRCQVRPGVHPAARWSVELVADCNVSFVNLFCARIVDSVTLPTARVSHPAPELAFIASTLTDEFAGRRQAPVINMRKALVGFVQRGCSNAHRARPGGAIDGVVAGREVSTVSKVVASAFARWVSSEELPRGFAGGDRRIGCWDGVAGGAHLRSFSSGNGGAESGALVSEERFHSVASDTLNMLQEKIEAYGEDLDVDGFDLDYSDGVMTVKLGDLGTYVLNKQTPNRQLWLSSPVSGPARFDWVVNENVWVYRRSKAELVSLLEQELSKLLKSPVTLKR